MKILLMAFRYGPSHGSILQTYALTRTLEGMGHEVTIVNRQRSANLLSYKKCAERVLKNLVKFKLSIHDFYLTGYPPVMSKEINKFIKRELLNQTITVSSSKQLNKIGQQDFDAFIVGSDQTWRPRFVNNIYDFFLDFVPAERNVKRIAYAPSFGTSEWEFSPEQEKRCRLLVSRFNRVSVREVEGIKLCKQHFGIDAQQVLDPSLLLTCDDYRALFTSHSHKSYLACNFLDTTTSKLNITDNVAKLLNLPVRQIIAMRDLSRPNVKNRVAPSIESWLEGLDNSKFAIVDSFHATVFCILFHKNFITVGNAVRGLARFTSLLDMLDLSNRLITDDDADNDKLRQLLAQPIDWDAVDNKLQAMRVKSKKFIESALCN